MKNLIQKFALAFACVALAYAPAFAQQAERPDWKVGDEWVYKVTEVNDGNKVSEYQHEIEKIDDGKIMIRRSEKNAEGVMVSGSLNTYNADMNYVTVEGKGVTSTPSSQSLQWPLQPGKKYPVEFSYVNTENSRKGSTDMKSEVSELQDITVPAGTFKAYKISSQGFWTRRDSEYSGSGKEAQTIWYAPEVKRWVKWETQNRRSSGDLFTNRVVELVKFTPGK